MNFIRTMRRAFAGVVLLGAALGAAGAPAQEAQKTKSWMLGGELDATPYATGGYYGSGFLGHDGWKYRYVVARTNIPSWMTSDGFRDKRTDAYALLADRFFGARREQLKGLWVGGGVEYWRNRIRTDKSPAEADYQNYVGTFGAGYTWWFSKHFYLNPWAAGHLVVAHSRKIPVAATTYTQPVFTPEASIKLGYSF